MKKSEAIKIISDKIVKNDKWLARNLPLKMIGDNLAISILKVIQEAGMLPPAHQCKLTGEFRYSWENEEE